MIEKTQNRWFYFFKRLPVILLVICVDLMYIFPFVLPDFAEKMLIEQVIPILYIISIVFLFLIKREKNGDYSLIKLALIGKIVLIPWFCLNAFFASMLFLSGIIIPLNWFGLPVILEMNLLMLIITSLYSTLGINSFYKKNRMSKRVLFSILQWIFVLDVISIIIVFVQSKNKHSLDNE